MRKLLMLLLLIPFFASSQVKQTYPQYGGLWKKLSLTWNGAFQLPRSPVSSKDLNISTMDSGQIWYYPTDSSIYYHTAFQAIRLMSTQDTTPMLANYFNSIGYGLLRSGQIIYFDSATVFPQIRSTVSETDPLSIHLTGTSTLTGNITVDGLTNSKRIFINGKGSGNSGVDIYAEGGFASITSNVGNYIGASGNDSAYIYLAGRTKFNDNAYSTSNTIQKDAPLTTLKVIGSNQTITFPYYGDNGYMIVLQNQNNSAFSWLTAGAPVVKPDGTAITSIPNQSISWYMWDDVSGSPTINSWVQFSLFDATAATTLYKARTKSKGLVIEFTTASENIGMWKTPYDITVTSLEAVLVGSSSPSVTFNVAFGSDRTSGTNVFSSGRTVTSTTTGSTFNSSFNDATIPAGSFIWITTSAQSGTVTQIELTINYTED